MLDKPPKELDEAPPIDDFYVTVQSAYTSLRKSRERLEITKKMLVPSLREQTYKPKLVVSMSTRDPLYFERKAVWRSTGLDVRFTERDKDRLPVTWRNVTKGDNWELPAGPRLAVMRIDDDDAISVDYVKITLDRANECNWNKAVLNWALGYVIYNDQLFRVCHKRNMFMTAVSNAGFSPHSIVHNHAGRYFRVIGINHSRGWVWNRHRFTLSRTGRKYRRRLAAKPTLSRWAIPLPGWS